MVVYIYRYLKKDFPMSFAQRECVLKQTTTSLPEAMKIANKFWANASTDHNKYYYIRYICR